MSHKKKNKELREDTWVGIRPSVMPARKGDKKRDRTENRQKCRDYLKGDRREHGEDERDNY